MIFIQQPSKKRKKQKPRPLERTRLRFAEPINTSPHPYIRGWGGQAQRLFLLLSLELISGRLARATVSNDFERNLLTFVEAAHASAFNG